MNNCIHCDQEAHAAFFAQAENKSIGPFCCQGCLTVYKILKGKGLEEYYEIKKSVESFKKRAPVQTRENNFTYLDQEDFQKEYSYLNGQGERTIEFYLEGIHCLACLWIIEKLPSLIPGVMNSKLNLGRSVLVLSLDQEGSFSMVARELDSIGYTPHALKINQTESEFKVKEERRNLIRIGVSGAAAGNIMLYAISIYAGAGLEYAQVFNALTVLFALPVLTYCAFPFYKNTFHSLKNKSISIDVPISLALIMGTFMGLYNLALGVPENYFDSLTALVFLLLLSRYFLKSIQEKGLNPSDLNFFYQSESLQKASSENLDEFTEIHLKQLAIGDVLKVKPNSMVPADGKIIRGSSYLNNALITGESELQKIQIGDQVFSGTQNISSEVLIEVTSLPKDSRLGKILQNIENGWSQKSEIFNVTNLVSKYFVMSVCFLSVLLFIAVLQSASTKEALERALTLLIVTCPCALAIATPLTFTRCLTKASQKGIIIKDDSVIEKMSKASMIFLDKTGTLTDRNLEISSFTIVKTPRVDFSTIIYHLEKYSKHPVAQSLRTYFTNSSGPQFEVLKEDYLEDYKEVPGVGVTGKINGISYKISNYEILENNELVARFEVNEKIHCDAVSSLKRLRDLGLRLQMISGDKKVKVEHMAQKLGLSSNEFLSELSPEMKLSLIKNSKNSIMVGDGANDAMAIKSASTGIAVFGAMDISLRAADVYLASPGLFQISKLILMSRETMKVIYRNLFLSLFYNSISVILAFSGHITPLIAAIIMPLSSLTVLLSSTIGTKKLRELWK